MQRRLTRRRLLALPVGLLLVPDPVAGAAKTRTDFTFRVDVGVLFDLLTFSVSGGLVEEIDWRAGRYRVAFAGEGAGVTNRTEAAGVIKRGRFMPTEMKSAGTVRGRQNRLEVAYDYERGRVEYHSVSHTLLLGRRREVHDVLRLPADQPLDDVVSATLNFAANRLEVGPDGFCRTAVVRRARAENEGPDEVSAHAYRAEIVPLRFRVTADPASGQLTALVDLTGFSSWARSNRPARLTFDARRHLESVESSLILGSTVKVRLEAGT
ncbi:MAG: hypothetical protein HYV93_21040 [Candidatus Rokubacteria bacterium]|nr:hypothetical protein [Candidatus Rokubacteria bacterium]